MYQPLFILGNFLQWLHQNSQHFFLLVLLKTSPRDEFQLTDGSLTELDKSVDYNWRWQQK